MSEQSNRIFTDEELAEMNKSTYDKLLDAIREGRKDDAEELLELLYAQFTKLHDGYGVWVAGLQTYIYDHMGIDALEEAEIFAHKAEDRALSFMPSGSTYRDFVQGFVKDLQGHVHQNMSVSEDDEKIVISVDPCGSGGRMIERGFYEPEIGLATIEEPHRITGMAKDFPIYCVHCPVMGAMRARDGGKPLSIVHPKFEPQTGHCEYHLYKNLDDVPEFYYEKLGLEKPKN